MPIEDIEDKLELIATELLSKNYNLEGFSFHLSNNYNGSNLEQYLENNNLDTLESTITTFKNQISAPRPYEGPERFTIDLLKTVDLK
jgi:hypothetical protein